MTSRTFLHDYAEKYRIARVTRSESGVLTVRLHTDDGPVQWGIDDDDPVDLSDLFADIANDPDNRAMIFTGSGTSFIAEMQLEAGFDEHHARLHSPETFEPAFRKERRMHANLLDIEVPIIAAVNGPAVSHSELPLLCDIVLASEDAVFQDRPHFPAGIPPGDGVQLIYNALLGPIRAKYFLLTGQKLSAQEALNWGVVNEVLPRDQLMARANELAERIVQAHPLTVRYTRRVINTQMRELFATQYDHALALEALAIVQLRGWRNHMPGTWPEWERPTFKND